MTIKNSPLEYGSVTKLFHWLIFFLVLIMICLGFIMGNIPDQNLRGFVVNVHKVTGLTILILMILRLVWALTNQKPKLPPNTPGWERFAELSMHGLLYLILIAMPLTGWLLSSAAGRAPHIFHFNIPLLPIPQSEHLTDIFAEIHGTIAWIIIVLVTLHILAALKHHFINKDNILLRMMPKKNVSDRIKSKFK